MIGVQSECGGPPPVMPLPHKMTNTIGNSQTPSSAAGGNGSSSNPNSNHNTLNSNHSLPPRQGSARERTVHALEYYNSNVLRVRVGAGLTTRSSVNERHLLNGRNGIHHAGHRLYPQHNDHLYRSNSSLELLHNDHMGNGAGGGSSGGANSNSNHHDLSIQSVPGLRREYGSHGSIDVISSDQTHQHAQGHAPPQRPTGESFFAMLQDYRPAVLGVIGTDQRSPGPAEYLRGKMGEQTIKSNLATSASGTQLNASMSNSSTAVNNIQQNHSINESLSEDSLDRGGSPKLRTKLHRFWPQSKQVRSNSATQSTLVAAVVNADDGSVVPSLSADIEERTRRRAFAHYDCQSLTANLGYAAKLRGLLLARRRNTTTGASAASMISARSSTPDSSNENLDDYGDGQCNELLENCPFFRNEIGGEEEREVSLTRFHNNINQKRAIHRPVLAYGVSILESEPTTSLWKDSTCPFQRGPRPIESVDSGARYYRKYFLGQEHQNWFGLDEQLGPVAISIKREKLPEIAQPDGSVSKEPTYQVRMIVRTSELLTLRGSIIEDCLPNPRHGKAASTKDLIDYVAPDLMISCLKLGVSTPQCEQQLLKLDEQGLTNKYKVGILYCRAGQSTEEDMYNNEEAGPAFLEFLDTVGKTVRLKGFESYKGGLDNKTDSTGTHSLYATSQDNEIMFHVSTMLPVTPNNRQQLLRKRHIGNDIVTIVFQEPGSLPFTPKNIRSQFQHVFVIVRVVNPCTDQTQYKVSVSRSKEVPVFGPPIRGGGLYSKGKSFSEFLLSKVRINHANLTRS